MVRCAISLGGNLGNVPDTFAEAVRLLTSSPGITELRTSRLYLTAPMGAVAGDAFYNAACVFETTLSPLDVLDLLQQIEDHCGRVRTVHWGPRTLDLDLILYGEDIIQSPPMASAGSTQMTDRAKSKSLLRCRCIA
jgi:2-amino-4-hydroxy-6-hydroxymethyldihydropteridine diphosphokinase